MKKTNFLILIISFITFFSCSNENIKGLDVLNETPTKVNGINGMGSVQTPDWYHFKYVDYYGFWGLKVTTLVQNDNVIGVYSEVANRPDFNQTGYSWSKAYSSSAGEYVYTITLNYSLQQLNLGWGLGNNSFWWEDFKTDSNTSNDDDEITVLKDNIATAEVIVTNTSITYKIKRSDLNSIEGPAFCINGICPE